MSIPFPQIAESVDDQEEDRQESKTFQERAFASFASATKKFHISNVLVIEKLSIMVKKYFETQPRLKKYEEEIDILIQYNKKLIEILTEF